MKFFSELGADVTATDLKTEEQLSPSVEALKPYRAKFSLGKHHMSDFLSADYIFKGPSVPWMLPELLEAEKKRIPIEMEAAFFASLCPAQIIGITGTRGKTTVSQMIYESLKGMRSGVYLSGNISGSSTIELLHKISTGDLVILELSSWQLSGFHRKKWSPHVAVFTNFYPDHLNYYKSEEEYFRDKSAIYAYQKPSDYLIANAQLKERLKKEDIKSTISYFSAKDFSTPLKYLRGAHNYENAAAALLIKKTLGNKLEQAIKTITEFKGVRYRQEIVEERNNVFFVNDSTSTTPISTIKALEAFNDGKVVLILGGNSKQLPFDELVARLDSVDFIALLQGSFTDEILSPLRKKFPEKISEPYDSLKVAVEKAYAVAQTFQQKTYILFSPGATSFGMFANEFDRARQFDELVRRL